MVQNMQAIRTTLRELGFEVRQGKGSHEVWIDPSQPKRRVVLHGRGSKDARRYQSAQIRRFRRA